MLGKSDLAPGHGRSKDGCQSALAQDFREPATDSVFRTHDHSGEKSQDRRDLTRKVGKHDFVFCARPLAGFRWVTHHACIIERKHWLVLPCHFSPAVNPPSLALRAPI